MVHCVAKVSDLGYNIFANPNTFRSDLFLKRDDQLTVAYIL